MAKIYTTGTINQPDAGSVGLTMVERIRDDVVAHPAWDLVEEFTPAGGAVRWYVFKCLGSANGLGTDFFMVIGRTLSNGELRMAICESYTAASHTMQYFGPGQSTSNFLFDASGRRSETYVLSTVVLPGGVNTPSYNNWVPAGTSTKWWIIVSEDSFHVGFNGPSNGFFGCGAYISLTANANPLPIMAMGSNGNNGSQYGVITRNVGVPGATVPGYATVFDRLQAYLGFKGDLRYNDRLQNNQRPVAEIGMTLEAWTADWPTQYGYALGKLKGIRMGSASAAGFAFGDAYALGGTLWVPYLPTDSMIWDTGVASS